MLVESDLRAAQADNLYDAILKLRPEFLRGEANQHGYYGTPNDVGAGPPPPGGILICIRQFKSTPASDDLPRQSASGQH